MESVTSSAVPWPNTGDMTTDERASVIAARTTAKLSVRKTPACRCSRRIESRWTRALPTPSVGMPIASSCTMTATAKRPKSAGGIRCARATIEPTRRSSVATRASVIQRTPSAVARCSSSVERASLTWLLRAAGDPAAAGAARADEAPEMRVVDAGRTARQAPRVAVEEGRAGQTRGRNARELERDRSSAHGTVWCRIQAHSPWRARPRSRPSAEPQ